MHHFPSELLMRTGLYNSFMNDFLLHYIDRTFDRALITLGIAAGREKK